MTQPLTSEHPLWAVLDEERRLLARLQAHLTTLDIKDAGAADYDKDLLALRDQIAEARLEDLPPLIDQMIQAQAVRSQRGLSRSLPINPQNPYFAHVRLLEFGKTRDVLVGKRSYIDSSHRISVVDWRNAPVSRIYYRYEEGDTYEEEFGEKLTEGRVLVRRTLSIKDGRLVRIRTPQGTLMCDGRGDWHVLDPAAPPELHGGVGTAVRPPRGNVAAGFSRAQRQLGLGDENGLREDKRLPEIAALIDKEQFDLMTRPETGVVVLQGGAGSGKTTVALHRVAYLHFANPERFRQRNMRVLVSQKALVSYIGRVLPNLDVPETTVATMETFLGRLRVQLFPRLRKKRVDSVPDAVARLKKHPAMLRLLEERCNWHLSETRAELLQLMTGIRGDEDAIARFDNGGSSLAAKLAALHRWLPHAPQPAQDRLAPWLRTALGQLVNPLDDLQEVLTDHPFLRDVFGRHAPGDVTDSALATLVDWVGRQASEPEDLSGVDREARTPVDHADDDETDPTDRLDPHDDALLIRHHQLMHGGLVPPGQSAIEFDHVAVDEAQDLTAIDLQILADATRGQSLTLAGDTQQRLVFDNQFDSWEMLLGYLKLRMLKVSTLKVAYRSTKEVIALARTILGPLADPDPPQAHRSGAPVECFRFTELGEEMAFLAEALRGLMARERSSNLAVVTRYAAQADAYYEALSRAEVPHLRRVAHQDFTFTPGIDITDVTQVKGLEYDYVILASVDDASYPDTLESRHLLHIGATRAAHQLWLTTSRPPTRLLSADLFAAL
jgi:DNA helicase-2/ATP-dependent DNA helicase PcrA